MENPLRLSRSVRSSRPSRAAASTLLAISIVAPVACAAAFLACGSSESPPPLSGVGDGTSTVGAGGTSSGVDASGILDGASVLGDAAFDGEADDASVVAFARLPAVANNLTIGGSSVYASLSDGEIVSISSTGAFTTLATIAHAGALTTVGNSLYVVIDSTTASAADGRVVAIDLTTHNVTSVADTRTGGGAITTNGTGVVWVDSGSGGMVSVVTAPFSGGSPTVLSTYTSSRTPGLLYVSGTNVYFTDSTFGQGDIYASGATTTATILATVTGSPNALAGDATNLYFTTSGAAGTVEQVGRVNGTAKILSPSEASPVGLQLLNNTLYWVNSTTGALMSYSLTASTEAIVGNGFTGATATAVSDSIYVALPGGTIVRAAL